MILAKVDRQGRENPVHTIIPSRMKNGEQQVVINFLWKRTLATASRLRA